MTNNWTDMGNSTLVIVMGANPSENHPASMAHINKARKGPHSWEDGAGNAHTSSKPAATLVVVDPRKTRTACQADLYVRIRPGTDIAFINGVVNYILGSSGLYASANVNKRTRWQAYHENTRSNTFYDSGGTKRAITRPKYSDASFKVTVPTVATADYVRPATQTIGGFTFADFPEVSVDGSGNPDMLASGTVYSRLAEHVAPYTLSVVADICGCTTSQIEQVANLVIQNSRCSSVASDSDAFSLTIKDPKDAHYRATTMLYAMGLTQHTYGSQNVKSFAVLQTLMGNMGRAGGGINALRGIHNVQGSTDMGLLYHLIPGYSGNPTGTFSTYMNKLYGNRLTDAYTFSQGGLQQKGFYSMTRAFFGDTPDRDASGVALSELADSSGTMDALFGLWPKNNGRNHIQMFRDMADGSGTTKAAVVWGQNPAVTEPNQTKVRAGLYELDTLVCVDMFENETAACNRKSGSKTYLIPACSHVEEAGSATNSGRVLQWRYQAINPIGNSKTDMELLLRFASALNDAGAFSHIETAWSGLGKGSWDAYTKLYDEQYGWAPGEAFDSEAVAEAVYKQLCKGQTTGGTMWLYLDGWDTSTTSRGGDWPTNIVINGVSNAMNGVRAKSRERGDLGAGSDPAKDGNLLYKNWGYSWLVNRRVLYNHSGASSDGDVPGDQNDGFQGPDQVARLFVSTNSNLIDYGTTYRSIHRLADTPKTPAGLDPAVHVLPGRFPAFTEPYESPREDLAGTWGYNSSGTAGNCLLSGTPRGVYADYPLVLTTIRCVEHFQGGPITRNNPYNHEAEPEPWIELNSLDARTLGISDGDRVKVTTARADSDSISPTPPYSYSPAGSERSWLGGPYFRARVGTGLEANQRVAKGVVAIPWHWGDRGLSTGARANDLTIDAMDANTTIPEYKACLCTIEKVPDEDL